MMKSIKGTTCLLVILLTIMLWATTLSIKSTGTQQAEAWVAAPALPPLYFGEIIDYQITNIAPGVTQTKINLKSDWGAQKIFLLDVGNDEPLISFQTGLSNGKILGLQPVSEQAQAVSREGHVVIGGVNADFHCTLTGFPLGLVIREGKILSNPNQFPAVGFRKEGKAIIGYPVLEISYLALGITHQINHINKPSESSLVLYTYDFGDSTQTDAQHTEVIFKKIAGQAKSGNKLVGVVQQVISGQGNHHLDENSFILASAGTATEALGHLVIGDIVEVSFNLLGEWHDVQEAVGGNIILLENGIITPVTRRYQAPAPRTAVGIRADGSIFLVVVDGRVPGHSAGINTRQLAQLMKDLGAVNALNLDGGVSSTQIARIPGDSQVSVSNRPAGGTERSIANSLLVISRAETGVLHPNRIRLTIGATAVSVNGEQQTLDAQPYIQTATNRTMVPVRFVSKMLGAEVVWDAQTRQVKIRDGAQTTRLTIGSKTVIIDGTTSTIDSVPEIQPPGRTFVPLRFISETLGAQVHYDQITKQITITR